MKIALRAAALLTLWLAASLCLGAFPKAAHASAFVNDIGNNRPVCAPAFNRAHPDLARFVAQAAEATLLIRCGNFVGSAVYVDTSSHRIVVTVEHIASNYSATNGKLVLDHVDDPKSCQVKNSRTGQWIAVDPAIAPKLGHPIDKLNLAGSVGLDGLGASTGSCRRHAAENRQRAANPRGQRAAHVRRGRMGRQARD
jgi:hypothetical protein